MKYCVMSNVRNEPDLIEWCIYHLMILKFNHIYICDNGSNPSVKDIIRNGDFKKDIKDVLNNNITIYTLLGPAIKTVARQHYLHHFKKDNDWTLFLDADEYLVLKTADNIIDFMNKDKFKNVDGVAFNWKMIGSGKILKRNDKLVIENFTDCNSTLNPEIKPILRNNKIMNSGYHPHIIPLINPHKIVNTHGEKTRYMGT